jgi:hypothetical protein
VLSFLGLRLDGPAGSAIDRHRHIARDRRPSQRAALQAKIRNCSMLCCAIVPDGDVPDAPTPTHGVFRTRNMIAASCTRGAVAKCSLMMLGKINVSSSAKDVIDC